MSVTPADDVAAGGRGVALWLPATAAAAAVIVHPHSGVAVLALTIAATVAFRLRGDGATVLCAVAVTTLLLPARQVFSPLGSVGSPAVLLSVGAFAWWLAQQVLPATSRIGQRQPARTAFWLVGASVMLSYVAAFFGPRSEVETRAADRGLVWSIALLGVGLLAADGIDTRERLDRVLRVLVGGSAVLAVTGILQFFTGIDPATELDLPILVELNDLGGILERADFRRVAGTSSHPIEFGVVLAMMIPLALHYLHVEQDPRRRRRWWLRLALLSTGVPMSLSRSAFLVLVPAGVILLAGWDWPRRRQMIAYGAVFAVAMKAAVPGLLGTIRSLFLNAGNDPSVAGRTRDYALVGRLFDEAPVLGRGFRTFVPESYFFLDNQYLMSIIETGIVGAVALAVLLLTGLHLARVTRVRSVDPVTRDLALSLGAAIFGAVLSFATFDALSFPQAALTTFLLIGCLGALWRLEAGRGAERP